MGRFEDLLADWDASALSKREEPFGLATLRERAEARLEAFAPMTVATRFAGFARIGFRPHGLYVPDDDDELRTFLRSETARVGDIPSRPQRIAQYHALQDTCEKWHSQGIAGKWTGQQAVARSEARFRLVAWGRRGGKSLLAAHESLVVALMRPRSWVWLAAPTMLGVSRCFDMVYNLILDLGLETRVLRNSPQDKLIVLQNGSKIEGVSLNDYQSPAGAGVDYAVIDEAARITPEAWQRAILPPLTDRSGQALLVSSYEGEGDFFQTKAVEALAEQEALGASSVWEMFQEPSWDINFYHFPQGRRSPNIVQAEREMPPLDFLEQFGAVPASARERVYPEFKERVHVGNYPFNPEHPVVLTCDPSSGPNPYAIVVIQDYGDRSLVIDELYETFTPAEELSKTMDARPWRDNVKDMVVDSAWPAEIERWAGLGYPAYPVYKKPQVWERLPVYRNLLRDPVRFHSFYRRRINSELAKMGLAADSDHQLPPDKQLLLALQVEESLAVLTDEEVKELRGCARIFIHRACINVIIEHKTYSYHKRRDRNTVYREEPKNYRSHCMDALGYWAWMWKRVEGETPISSTYLSSVEILGGQDAREPPHPRAERWRRFLGEMRETHGGGQARRGRSYLVAVR